MAKVFSIYGISDRNKFRYPGFVHDHNLCITEEENLIHYYHLERITRVKYDNTLSDHIEKLILENDDIRVEPNNTFLFVNSFVGSSFISKNGRVRFDCMNQTVDLLEPVKGYCWIQNSDWEGFEVPAYSVSHEIAHAFSAVPFADGLKENSLLIAFDGGSSKGNFAAFHYKNGILKQLECNWNLSHLSKLFNDNGLSFAIMNAEPGEHCSVPGKLMGYASWGKYRPEHEKWLVDNEYFRQSWGARHDFIEKATADFRWNGNFGNNKDSFLFDIAATMQEIFRKGILGKIKNLALETGAEYLYYAGGCALNIVANADLVSENWFKDVFISPCCNDSGLSIGASAYWAFLNKRELKIESPYSNTWGTQGTYSFSMEDIIQTATNLVDGKVVGVCNGFGEAGPRALGNRSILSLANSKSLSEHVSMVLKEREWYRPVAPIMQEKNAMLYTGLNKIHHLSKYMLLDFQILTEYHRELQGVVHSNGTARIQTVFSENDNPFIFHLLKYLDEQLGIRALINTSFNGKGEPIVQTSEHAIESAIRMKLDGIVINGKFQNL